MLQTSFYPETMRSQLNKSQHSRSKSIDSNAFTQWASNNMYKSSYAHFHSKDSTQPRNSVIPGYQGFIPKVRAESLQARGYTSLTKEVLGNNNFGKNKTGLSSNGFNVTHDALIDHSLPSHTSKYGNSSWLKAHPNWQGQEWKSITRSTYVDPRELVNPVFRQGDKNHVLQNKQIKKSGFSTNRDYWDGTGWNPEQILKAQNIASQYRNIYNPEQNFHRDVNISKARKLKRPEQNYKFNA